MVIKHLDYLRGCIFKSYVNTIMNKESMDLVQTEPLGFLLIMALKVFLIIISLGNSLKSRVISKLC